MTVAVEIQRQQSPAKRSSGASVVIIDAESTALGHLRSRLQADGHAVLTASSLDEGLVLCRTTEPDVILLDPLLGTTPRFDVCDMLRAETEAGIIVLSSSHEEADKIIAFEMGADDYVTKPYQLAELMARIRRLLRRLRTTARPRQRVFTVRDLTLDMSRRELLRGGERVELRPREYELLAFLIENRGQAFSRTQLLHRLWGYHGESRTRTVDVHIERLRRKIEEDPSAPQLLITVRGVGYMFNG